MNSLQNLPKISVVIPCHNQGKFIIEAVESVKVQTFKDFEVIIVDDGSTETETKKIFQEIPALYPEVKLVRQENKGIAAARNAGISVARGEFFLPLDADDTIEPAMLEKCFEVLRNDSKLGFAYAAVRYFGDFEAVWRPREYNFFDLLQANQLTATALVRKKAWEEAGGYDEEMRGGYEDWEFWINLGSRGWFGKLISEPLFNYRRHALSMTDDAREGHKKNFAYIKEKHSGLYAPEAQKKAKAQWGSFAEEEAKREKTFFGRLRKLKKKLELAGAWSFRSWLRHPARTFYRAIPIRWKTSGRINLRAREKKGS